MEESQKRWLSNCPQETELDIILRMKAHLEATGGTEIRRLMGDENAVSQYRVGTLDWKLAVNFNTSASLGAEVCLKGIMTGAEGKEAPKTHDLMKGLYRRLRAETRDQVDKEYEVLRALASGACVEKEPGLKTLEETIRELDGRFEKYRYLDTGGQIEAHEWWSMRLAVRSLGNAAATWLKQPPKVEGYPGTMMVSDERLEAHDREILQRNTQSWMQRVLGYDIPRGPKARNEDDVWHKP